MDHRVELEDELVRLQVVLVRKLREKLEGDGTLTPQALDVARKVLMDLTRDRRPPPAPAVSLDLPFPGEDQDE